ncbi:restriction endonuclease subunit S [Bacillus mojavensis]|uniref:restriction endonuclease subunit S n=1 Tax=Bacillus mojavensis TaxID=72360 RepID=UPI0002882D45|nr:restriction endonuclease subunit S [Bacillus mojavensis]MDR4229250.1 restriction endonuclease subunit S [Bacillus mojavensis]MEC3590140.1 restriction endonuclease subunit S [Bacillus mojavensis]MEC5242707.1 restriction endonuclease subunit S [Bacillus mojavensis]MED0751326.1 restriction endonuclease subunit S [Bacillus mojavensis]
MKRETWFNNEIPRGWEVTRLKSVIISVKNGIWGDEPLNNSDDIECVRIADFDRKKNIVKDKEFTLRNIPKIQSENYLLKKGDLLIEKSGGGEKQPVGFVVQYNLDKKAVYANFMAKIELNSQKVDSTFMNYVFSSLYAVKANLKAFNQTTGIQNLNKSVYLNEVFMYPSLNVQKNIVNFLNKKIQAIDETINKKQKMVELLEQQRQSIITEAVTKGLNSNVKMKDSGVEWIGEIPEHWTVNKIKRIVDILTCGYASTPTYVDESKGVPFLSAQNVSRSGKLKLEKYNYISQELHNSLTKYKKPMKGDILQVRVGAGIGQTCIVDVDFDFSIYVSLSHIRVKKFIHNKYLTYILGSRNFNEYANMQTLQAGGVGNLNVSDLEKSKIPYPSLKEQIEIASYLEVECSKIDNLVESINKQIEKLKEYRQALIYEAVTGKIDVRDMELD